VRLFVESSAVLCWLLGEPGAAAVRGPLAAAELVVASDLVLVECDRVLTRVVAGGERSEAAVADRRALLERTAAHWNLMPVAAEVIERARRPFPREPVRTLDALHLASALVARARLPGLAVLSLDRRFRDNAHRLGFEVVPDVR
jgi:predicted nucleic acid-binding protein